MTIRVPDIFKSSKGDGRISRTIKGIAAAVVFIGAMYTPLSEVDITKWINQALIAASALYALYGLSAKIYHQWK